MSALDQIVQVTITQQTQAVQQPSFSIPCIFGPTDAWTPVTTTATTVSGSNVIAVASTTGLSKGQGVSGTGIPADTYVVAIVGLNVTLSRNATASGSGVTITFSDLIRAYTSLAGMVADGFETSDPEYVRAVKLLSQALQPTIFYVGHYGAPIAQIDTATPDPQINTTYTVTIDGVPYTYATNASGAVAQVDTITPTPVDSHLYRVTINGTDFTFLAGSGTTATLIVTGLKNLINASSVPVTASGTTTLILTADVAGVAFTTSVNGDSDMALVHTTPNDPGTTAAIIVAALLALVNADSDAPCVATGSTTLILTGKTAGVGFTTTVTASLSLVHTTPNHTITSDIAAAQTSPSGDLWYGLTICSQVKANILQVAAYIETQLKIFIADSNDADIITSATDDVASQLKALSYTRTGILYAGTANDGRAAAWLGGQLPQVPGASTWKFKTLIGITPDSLTAAQRLICIGIPGTAGKNCNIYETIGGVPITEEGFMSGGQFIDLTVGLDWLASTLQTNVYSLLVQNPKVPYTVQGEGLVENAVRQTLLQGVGNNLIDGNSAITVTVPDIADIPTNDRAERLLPDVTFACRLAGALHFVQINGSVSV